MSGNRKIIFLAGALFAGLLMTETKASSFPLRAAAPPNALLLSYIHGHHCNQRYSRELGWHRHLETCDDSLRGWCWYDASGNRLCIGDIRRRDRNECRSNPYALGCRTEHWDNR
jgi:hypothetical protein